MDEGEVERLAQRRGHLHLDKAPKLPPHASTIRRRSFRCRTPEGVEWGLPTAGEREQCEVEERSQRMFRPAATGPIWIVDWASRSVGWRCAHTVLQSA